MRGVTLHSGYISLAYEISTHTPHARRDYARIIENNGKYISTHTPHARRDPILIKMKTK